MHLLFAVLLAVHWLLVSDLHVEPGRSASAPATYGSDTNWALFDSTVAAMRKADPDPPVVMISGDFLAHHFPRNVPLAERTMARIAKTFNAAFPHAQFIIVAGNNDDPCGDYRATPGDPYFAYLAHLWAPLVNRNGAAPQFERDFARYGWYTATLPAHLRAVALDSVYWSILYRRCANYHPDAPARELKWFENTLRGLPQNTRALPIMHIPPGVDPFGTLVVKRLLVVPYWQDDYVQQFARTLTIHQRSIAFAIAGHAHRDDFRLPGHVPVLIAPSISPVYDNNPSFLRLDLASDGTLQDYRPFIYNEFSGAWETGDSFDATFGAASFTSASVKALHDRLRTDEALRARWARWFVSYSDKREIRSDTWRLYWCAQTASPSAYVGCAGLGKRVELLPIAAGVGIAALLALLTLIAVRLGRQRRRV
jgi:sphingomyelin phosphodiesterase acid-like 3